MNSNNLQFKRHAVTYSLIAINIVIYLIETFLGGSTNTEVALHFGVLYTPYVIAYGQWWRLFTAMFLHFGIMHLASNMLSLYLLGRGAESLLGHARMLGLYLASGIAGNVLTLVVELVSNGYDPSDSTLTSFNFSAGAGASGAIFGLVGIFLAMALLKEFRRFVNVRDLVAMLVINLAYGLSDSSINMWAHLGGLITGTIIALIMLEAVLHKIKTRAR